MNRIIKFRAWIKEDEEMKGYMHDHIDPNLNYSEAIDTHNENSYLILMQFTGLLDKNGKEIYESDIVKIEYSNFDDDISGESISIVEWDDYHCGLRVKNHNCSPNKNWEVIGNIYEHPELLTLPTNS